MKQKEEQVKDFKQEVLKEEEQAKLKEQEQLVDNLESKTQEQNNSIEEQTIMPKENILGTEKIGKLLMKFSIPCIISLLVSSLYNIVDQIFIGQGVGYLGNAATNIVFPLTVIATAFALLIGDGAAAN